VRGALKFLTEDDYHRLESSLRTVALRPREVIVREGVREGRLYCLRSGLLRVEADHYGEPVAVEYIGPGEVFGEISLVEDAGASATVVADQPADVLYIEQQELESLMRTVPGFGARFYRSIAFVLAQRLRRASRPGVPPFGTG
jgi:CRP-like cAMP-binding protein